MPISPTGILNRQQGFTLIELLVVIALLAIFSGLSLPLLLDRIDGGERRSLRKLTGTVKQLYNEATLTRDPHLLTFDLDRNRIAAFRLRQQGGQQEQQPVGKGASLDPLRLSQVDVVGQGSFRSGQVTIRIFPLGWMEQTRVVLNDSENQSRNIDFSPLTGRAKIADEAF